MNFLAAISQLQQLSTTVIFILFVLISTAQISFHYYLLYYLVNTCITFKFTNLDYIILTNGCTSLTHITSRYKIFISFQKVLLCLFKSIPPHPPQTTTISIKKNIGLPVLELHIHQIIQYMLPYIQLLSLSVIWISHLQ